MLRRPINQNNEAYKKAIKVAKRIAITMLCCLPVLLIFGYLTRNIITIDALQITCFVIIMGIAVAIVEVVARSREKRKEAMAQFETQKDVFK